MAKNEVKQTEALSKSKQKRADRQNQNLKIKKQKALSNAIKLIVLVLIVGVFAFFIGQSIYKKATTTQSSNEYSKGLASDGKVEGVNPLDYITLADYKNLVVPKTEVEASSETIESDITSALESNKSVSDDSSIKIADGDTVNIDYVGSIDGVEFEGGNSNGEGYDLEIGSGSFIDTFEEQLVGHTPGEEITVNVTFPEDYTNEELAGKAAEFAVTIHGVYVTPEFDDAFVQEHYGDVASTPDEYREYLSNKYYKENLTTYVTDYLVNNTTLNKVPKSYLKTVKSLLKGNDEYTLSYYSQMYAQYGITGMTNLWDLVEGAEDEAGYEKDLASRAEESVKEALAYQAVFEAEDLSLDLDSYYASLDEEGGEGYADSIKESYGEAYVSQSRMKDLVVEYLVANANVQ